jgi:hypothetical protein
MARPRFRFTASVLLPILSAAACAPLPPPLPAPFDPTGTWVTTPEGAGDAGIDQPLRGSRFVVDRRYVLDPIGQDCTSGPTYRFQPPSLFMSLLAARQWPDSWIGLYADGYDIVQEVSVSCGRRPLLRLLLLSPWRALLLREDGSVLLLYKTHLRQS